METPAWRALSTTAQALYPWIKLEWRGLEYNNNGKIRLSVRQAAARMGVNIKTAARAFLELQGKGFIVQTEFAYLGIAGAARSPAYEITELKMPGAEGDGRKLYRDWKPGSDFPVHVSHANNPLGKNKTLSPKLGRSCPQKGDEQEKHVPKNGTACSENGDEYDCFDEPFVPKIGTSLSYHTSTPVSGPAQPAAQTGRQAPRARAKADKRAAFKSLLQDATAALTVKTEGDCDAA
jgi:hypothetical protein